MDELRREELTAETIALADELIRRLSFGAREGRLELVFLNGQVQRAWPHPAFARSELVRFDPLT
jgi:hypothetical protein